MAAKNVAVDSGKMSKALEYLYRKAKRTGKLKNILTEGGFKESAITAAIRRGTVSRHMVEVFSNTMGVLNEEITGEKDFDENAYELKQESEPRMTDQELLKALEYIIMTKDVSRSAEKYDVLRKVKRVIAEINI